jgi:diaminopimelate epimerase
VSELRFSKWQAAGNDFLIVDDLASDVGSFAPGVARALCDRWVGVGADGLIRLCAGTAAPFRFELTNADGSPAELSGNGLRCLGGFLRRRAATPQDAFEIETVAGVRRVALAPDGDHAVDATVSMGTPNFTKAAIPMRGPAWETFLGQSFELGGGLRVDASAVSMGNPHLVLFVQEDPERFHVEHLGPALEHHEWFPERVNVEFARIGDDGAIDVRVWERGVGETLSCGTGACAVVVAAHEAGLVAPRAMVRFRGGSLTVERRDDGEVVLGGPVAHVFDGVIDPDALA